MLVEQNVGSELALVEGLYWAADHGADVISMSLSFGLDYVPSPALLAALQYAHDGGVVMLAAAGNDGAKAISWPAASPLVIAVAAGRAGKHDDKPDDGWVFLPEPGTGLSEVPVIHREPGDGQPESRVTGIIDRLVMRPGRADIIDYKTNRTGGDSARIDHLVEHYRPQLEAYRQVVGSLYPELAIHTWLLFTEPEIGTGGGLLKEVF